MPVVETAYVVWPTVRAPSAIALATCSLTAPYASNISCGTPKTRCFTSLLYEMTPPI